MTKLFVIFVVLYSVLELSTAANIRDKRHVFTDAMGRMEDAADRVRHEFSRVFGRESKVSKNLY